MATLKGSSPDAHPADQIRIERSRFAKRSSGTIDSRRYSHISSSRKNDVTLIRIVLKRRVNSSASASR